MQALREDRGFSRVDVRQVLLDRYPDAPKQIDHHFVLSTLSGHMNLEAFYAKERQALWTAVSFGEHVQNVNGVVHGGIISTAFDQMFGTLFAILGYRGATANLAVNFRKPTPAQMALLLKTVVANVNGRKVSMQATLELGVAADWAN